MKESSAAGSTLGGTVAAVSTLGATVLAGATAGGIGGAASILGGTEASVSTLGRTRAPGSDLGEPGAATDVRTSGAGFPALPLGSSISVVGTLTGASIARLRVGSETFLAGLVAESISFAESSP